jgi:Asp-tRNA(Asn)/Glu-tRNA(Gln) amidotransferase A subunit family amidase
VNHHSEIRRKAFSITPTMSSKLYQLTATEVLAKIRDSEITVEDYARSLLKRIESRDEAVQAWAYLDPDYVIKQAQALDAVPHSERGPLHGVAIAVKDVIYTKRRFKPGLPYRHDF